MRCRVFLTIAFLLAAAGAQAQESTGAGVTAEVGGLHRVAAALDATLDIYRLALVEIVPAAKRVREAGLAKGAMPETPVPEPVLAVATRLRNSLENRVPTAALPPVARGYHAEVIEALADLSSAMRLDQTRVPLHNLLRAMGAVGDEADEIVDLFSRKRPLALDIVDPATVLDDISEALDEVGAAERQIVRLRRGRATLGEQLHAFLQLEVALAHALDMIAGAEEAGVHIGFELSLSTTEFADKLGRVREQLDALEAVVHDLDVPPPPIAGGMRADLLPAQKGVAAEVRLQWAPPGGESRPAAVRVYRRRNIEQIRRDARAAFGCEGRALDEAERMAQDATAELTGEPRLVAEQPAGRSGFTDELADRPLAPPVYEVATSTAFGVETPGPQAAATWVPRAMSGPPWVGARSMTPAPDSGEFYRDFDAVEVRWEPSPNDTTVIAARARYAQEHRVPTVDHYRVTRVVDEQPAHVARLPAGTRRWVDRPPPEALKTGVRYVVVAVGSNGMRGQAPQECAMTAAVSVDLASLLARARSGLSAIQHPTRIERAAREKLAEPGELRRQRRAFQQRPVDEQRRLLALWWSSQPESRRQAWLAELPGLLSEAQKEAWLAAAPDHIQERDLPRARLEVWLAEQPLEIQYEVERWWALMDEASRRQALAAWRRTLDRAHRAWVDEQWPSANPDQRHRLQRDARIMAWWHARDRREQEALARWWLGKTAAERRHAVSRWLESLPGPAQIGVRWPDSEQLSETERARRLETLPEPLPEKLWPDLLAWLEWQALAKAGGEALDAAVRSEVGTLSRGLIAFRFWSRPLDKALGFRLPVIGALLLLMVVLGVVLLMRLRRRRRQIVVPAH